MTVPAVARRGPHRDARPSRARTVAVYAGALFVLLASLFTSFAVLLDARICASSCGRSPGSTGSFVFTVLVPLTASAAAVTAVRRRHTWSGRRVAAAYAAAAFLLTVAWIVAQARYPGEVNAFG